LIFIATHEPKFMGFALKERRFDLLNPLVVMPTSWSRFDSFRS
jgi:hypothetical protein